MPLAVGGTGVRGMRIWLSAFIAATVGASTASAQPASAQPALSMAGSFELANGLRVILQEDHTVPLVSISLLYRVGCVNEPPGRSGLAHLFEHLMLSGSLHIPTERRYDVLARIGAIDTGGTDNDYTIYYALGPKGALETLLWLQSDRMGFLFPAVDERRLNNQKAVVRNERRQTVENRPYGLADERIVQHLFPAPHPYHWYTIGSHEDLERVSFDEVESFFTRHYGPNNATLVVVGDFDRDKVRSAVTKYFATIDSVSPPAMPSGISVQTPPRSEIRDSLADNVELPRISFGWIAPPAFGDAHVEFELLATVLGQGRSGLLTRTLVQERHVAHEVLCTYWPYRLGSYFQCDVLARRGVALSDVELAFDQVLDAVRRKGIDESDLLRAQAQQQSQILYGLENLVDRSKLLNRYAFYTGNPTYYAKHFRDISAATTSSIRRTAERWLGGNRVVVIVKPRTAQ